MADEKQQDQINHPLLEKARKLFEATKERFGQEFPGLANLTWEQVRDRVVQHVQEHPKMTAFQLVTLLFPGLIAGPLFAVLGFSGVGPVAGGLAASFQSAFGTNAVFSTLQSAAMGGYGVPVVNGIIQGGSVVAGALTGLFAGRGANGTDDRDPTLREQEQEQERQLSAADAEEIEQIKAPRKELGELVKDESGGGKDDESKTVV